jgi:hypothetical protein
MSRSSGSDVRTLRLPGLGWVFHLKMLSPSTFDGRTGIRSATSTSATAVGYAFIRAAEAASRRYAGLERA